MNFIDILIQGNFLSVRSQEELIDSIKQHDFEVVNNISLNPFNSKRLKVC